MYTFIILLILFLCFAGIQAETTTPSIAALVGGAKRNKARNFAKSVNFKTILFFIVNKRRNNGKIEYQTFG
jgi:hypothetical protein